MPEAAVSAAAVAAAAMAPLPVALTDNTTSAGNVGKGMVGCNRCKLLPSENSRGCIGRNGVRLFGVSLGLLGLVFGVGSNWDDGCCVG